MSDIQQVAPILTVIEDAGEYILQARSPIGKRLGSLVLGAIADATRVTYTDETGIKVFKNTAPRGQNGAQTHPPAAIPSPPETPEALPPSRPALPPSKRIFQDGAAPPAAELVEEDYRAQLAAQEAEQRALAQQEQFNSQNAVQEQPAEAEAEQPTRARKPRNLAVAGSPCGRCGGAGQIQGDSGHQGMCPVCQGKGEIQKWGTGRASRQAR